jgi:ABC-2 type transport system permease protein
MLSNVFAKSLRDHRKALIWWAIGIVALALLQVVFYPSIGKAEEMAKLFEENRFFKVFAGDIPDITSPEGYLNSQLFFMMIPILFMIFAITLGSGAIAGEEERGTLDLLLSNPLPRWRVVLEKSATMVVATLLLGLAFWIGLSLGALGVRMEISYLHMAEATFSGVLLGLVYGAIALAAGCLWGKRGLSVGVATALGVAGYFLNALAPLVEGLKTWRRLSPFYFYIGADPLLNGLKGSHVAVLLSLIVLFIGISLLAFQRRDIGV